VKTKKPAARSKSLREVDCTHLMGHAVETETHVIEDCDFSDGETVIINSDDEIIVPVFAKSNAGGDAFSFNMMIDVNL